MLCLFWKIKFIVFECLYLSLESDVRKNTQCSYPELLRKNTNKPSKEKYTNVLTFPMQQLCHIDLGVIINLKT